MKKYIYLLGFICLTFSVSQAQIIKRCGTYEVHQMKMDTDPVYKAGYENYIQNMQQWAAQRGQERTAVTPAEASSTIIIPVVVHIVYKTSDENISDAQVQSQIDVLNEDYSGSNADQNQIPPAFKAVFGNANLHFALATRTPTGTWTTGIERKQTSVDSFGIGDPGVKYASEGGLDAWDRTKYLNLWVCHLDYGLLGWSTIPNPALPDAAEDGSVVVYKAFGRVGNLYPYYNEGRTATHEVGHWLGLIHIWGDDGGLCPGDPGGKDDNMADTPPQSDATTNCPSYPKTDACSPSAPGIMFVNYMDYSLDECMHMFTVDQVAWMRNILDNYRTSILTSNGADEPAGIAELNADAFIAIYPNPASDNLHVDLRFPSAKVLNATVVDMVGKEIYIMPTAKTNQQNLNVDASSFNAGLYMLVVNTDLGTVAKRFAVVH